MSDPSTELREVFREEAARRVDEMETALLAIESGEASGEEVNSLFRNMHTLKGTGSMVGFDRVSRVAHAAEDILAVVRDTGTFPAGLVEPLFRASTAIRQLSNGEDVPLDAILGELAASLADLTSPAVQSGAAPGPARVPDQRAVSPAEEPRAGEETDRGPRDPAASQRSVRVSPGKIDHLLDMIGEAVEDGRRLGHALASEQGVPESVADALRASERTLDELKDTAIKLRTQPLAAIAGPLPGIARELARAVGKEISFTVTGAETELDRVVLESLTDPLVHLLRNAVAHGIEPPAERERAGKPRRGQVELRATPRGSQVEIVLADDGKGVSAEIAERARREGSLADVLASAGYSTTAQVTELSGRGVGLDAVRSYAQSLGGSFEVRSEPGRGMVVVLLLPLALALMMVLLFERGGAVFGVPLSAVQEVVTVAETGTIQGRPSLELRGRAVPVADAAALLGAQAPTLRQRSPALVIAVPGHRIAVACDTLLGEEEVSVKPLGLLLAGVHGYLGAAILADGRIALLAEPAALARGRAPASAGMPQAAPRDPGPGQAAASRILVVEDSFTVRELQRSILEAAGYQVATARDGGEALRLVKRDPRIDLVITDVQMPELDGLELTRAIRADPAHASLPVVIVTSMGSEEDQRKGIEAGADAFMVKRTFDQQALLATVERLIGR
jgi:two-component system, chemotaxis family, sensor kinase CheA